MYVVSIKEKHYFCGITTARKTICDKAKNGNIGNFSDFLPNYLQFTFFFTTFANINKIDYTLVYLNIFKESKQ